MTDEEAKRIGELITKALKPIRDAISPLGARLDVMNSRQEMTNDKLDKLQETTDKMQETLDGQTGALISIESVLKGYADMYKINKSDIDKIKKHVGLSITVD